MRSIASLHRVLGLQEEARPRARTDVTTRAGRGVDNFSAHKGDRARKLIEELDWELVYLPPYSPDLNPIEEAFNKMKGIVRKVGARSREALVEVMGKVLDAITSWNAKGFRDHCGYRSPGQLLGHRCR